MPVGTAIAVMAIAPVETSAFLKTDEEP